MNMKEKLIGILLDATSISICEAERVAELVLDELREPTDGMVRAASENCAWDDEGQLPPLCELIDYSGENKTRTVVRSALSAAILAAKSGK